METIRVEKVIQSNGTVVLEAVWKLKEMNQKAKIVNYQLSIINCF